MTTNVCDDGVLDYRGAVGRFQGLLGLLPQLAQPWWYRHAHSGHWHPEQGRGKTDAATQKAERREARKAERLARALAGESTPVRRRAA